MIEEYLATGKLRFYEELKKQVPQELHELLQIPGIGPKTVQYLHKELGIESVKELEKAAKEQIERIEPAGSLRRRKETGSQFIWHIFTVFHRFKRTQYKTP